MFQHSSPAHSVYFLREGLVKTSAISENGEELILAIHQPGEIFGELCLCGGERREQALAMEPSEVVEIPFGALMAYLARQPADADRLPLQLGAASLEGLQPTANARL